MKEFYQYMRAYMRVFILVILLMMTIGTVMYSSTAKELHKQMGNQCISIASSVATLVKQDLEGYLAFRETLDTDSEYYKKTKAMLEEIRYANEESIRFLYIQDRVSDSEVMYIIDGDKETDEMFCPAGYIDEITFAERQAYEGQKEYIGDKFVKNKYGNLLNAFAPIYDHEMNLIGLVGVDMTSEQYHQVMIYQLVVVVAGIVLMFVIIAVMTGVIIRMYREKMQANQENLSKTSFLATMSHEIRTPMNAIMGMSELMMREELTEKVQMQAENINRAAENLLSIINDILDFSKIESGKMEIIEKPYHLSSLINDVLNIFSVRLMDKTILFVADIDSQIPDHLIGDEVRVRQIFTNVLSNAVKYTKKGMVSIKVRGGLRDSTAIVLNIEVTDTGMGIKKEDADKLFEDFTQLDVEKNHKVQGSGLGLAITRSLCREMNGDISVQSVYGEGSTFFIRLPQRFDAYIPFAKVDFAEQKSVLLYETREAYAKSILYNLDSLEVRCALVTSRAQFAEALKKHRYSHAFVNSLLYEEVKKVLREYAAETIPVLISKDNNEGRTDVANISMPSHSRAIANILNNKKDGGAYTKKKGKKVRFTAPEARVLIVDDVVTNLVIAEGLLSPFGMMIDRATSGAEAIELVQLNRYDMVLMDHMMQEMDGIECTKQIRALGELDDYYRNLPIIALTANAVSGMQEMFLENGMNDFIAKPIETAKLFAAVENWIPRRKWVKNEKKDMVCESSELQIDGVDTEQGMHMLEGNKNAYETALRTFYYDAMEKIEQIKTVWELQDISLFTTYVHAIKSASASLGVMGISEQAKNLENAGRNNELDFIKNGLSSFLTDLETVAKNIGQALPEMQRKTESNIQDNRDMLLRLLSALKEGLEQIDIENVDDVQKKLRETAWSGKVTRQLEKIYQAILLFEYEEAIEIIDKISKEL